MESHCIHVDKEALKRTSDLLGVRHQTPKVLTSVFKVFMSVALTNGAEQFDWKTSFSCSGWQRRQTYLSQPGVINICLMANVNFPAEHNNGTAAVYTNINLAWCF